MSLILEALRKSEAERRRGEAPGLRVELPPVAPPGRHAVPAWTWIAAAAIVLLALPVTFWPRDGGSGAGSGPGADRGTDTDTGYATATDPGIDTDTGASFPRVERIVPPDPPAAEATAAGPLPAAAPDSASTRPADPAGSAAPAATDPATPSPARTEDAARPTAATATPTATTPQPTPRPGAGIPRIAGLASAQRQRLPAMKLSMHMWNEDPARRFVVIDGQRKVEGDRVGDARIVAIDRDGVLLDLDGSPVRVPLP